MPFGAQKEGFDLDLGIRLMEWKATSPLQLYNSSLSVGSLADSISHRASYFYHRHLRHAHHLSTVSADLSPKLGDF